VFSPRLGRGRGRRELAVLGVGLFYLSPRSQELNDLVRALARSAANFIKAA
jgi:hypothetical protein